MIKIEFTTNDIQQLHYWRFHHPHPKVQLKMEVLFLKSQGLSKQDILPLCAISESTYYRYLHLYIEGGVKSLKEIYLKTKPSQLADFRSTIEAYFRQHPPQTLAEACAKIEELTAIRRGPTQVGKFLKSLGMKPRKVGHIPAKADVEQQENFLQEQLEPRLKEALSGERAVLFVDAAHFIFAPFLGIVWCFERLFIKAPSGRQRLNVLAALNAITKEIITIKNLTYIRAETVCELLSELALRYPSLAVTVVLDNARYQRCKLVQEKAAKLGIELMYLPTYSPNLNLIERFWKYVKKKCLNSRYYEDKQSWEKAIEKCIEEAPEKNKEEMESLLTLKFQSFKEVKVIGEESKVKVFPVVKQKRKKLSSQAA